VAHTKLRSWKCTMVAHTCAPYSDGKVANRDT
jgi:hypothetical protein